MPNAIKYSTTGDTLSLKKGNIFFGVGDVGKGPSSATTYYNGVTPSVNGYTIYSYNESQTSKLSFHSANSDFALREYTNIISGESFASAGECLNWYATQSNYVCVNRDYGGIVTDGLVLNLDVGFTSSYPTTNITWYDLSYSNNNGTLTNGPTYSTDGGGSIVFDGVDNYVNIGVNKSCNRFTGDFAVSVWVNRQNAGVQWGNIIGDYFTNSTPNALEWQIMISNTAQLFVYNVTNGYVVNPIESGFNVGTWINVVLSRIGSTLSLYANSNFITSVTNTTTFGSATGNLNIGVDGNNSAEPLTGRITNVMIYKNKGLTFSEVLQNYQAQLPTILNENIVTNGLVLYLDATYRTSYPTTGTTWTNVSGVSGFTGTLTNGPTYDSENGGSIVFDGVDDYVDCGNGPSLDFGIGSATIGVWFKTSASIGALCTKREGSGFQFYVYSNKLYADGAGTATGVYSSTNVNTNTWVYGVVVYDRVGGLIRLYVNGVADGTTSLGSTTLTDVANCNIGRETLNTPGDYYSGNISLVNIYNRALNSTEILQNFDSQKTRFAKILAYSIVNFWTKSGENIYDNGSYEIYLKANPETMLYDSGLYVGTLIHNYTNPQFTKNNITACIVDVTVSVNLDDSKTFIVGDFKTNSGSLTNSRPNRTEQYYIDIISPFIPLYNDIF